MAGPVASPTLTLQVDDLVDWLELTALFDPYGVARLDALLGSLQGLEETAEDDIAERDRQREARVEKIENEVDIRTKNLGETYPFFLSPDGEVLQIFEDWQHQRFVFYLICLVTSHIAGSSILEKPPSEGLTKRLRNRIFQIVATLGLAGHSSGPAFSIGWPRNTQETVVQVLERAAAAGGGFNVRNPPGPYTSPHEKDGGIDVIGWTSDGPPPPVTFYFGQTASGKNWPGKPVFDHARVFGTAYMADHMTGNRNYITMIPYRVLDVAFWNSQSLLHMGILDRLRLPGRAWSGVQIAQRGIPVDDGDSVEEISAWLADYIGYASEA